MHFAFHKFHIGRGTREICFTYSCPRCSRCPGSEWICLSLSSCTFPSLIHIVLLNIARPREAAHSAFTPARGAGHGRCWQERGWAAAAASPVRAVSGRDPATPRHHQHEGGGFEARFVTPSPSRSGAPGTAGTSLCGRQRRRGAASHLGPG